MPHILHKGIENMQELEQISLNTKAKEIFAKLIEFYGEPKWESEGNAIDTLIGTILSANTNDVNSGRAFNQLMQTFQGDWDTIRTAPLHQVIDAIRPAGMYNQKAPAIVATLKKIHEDRGEYSIDFLASLPVEDALIYLTQFPGVGHKTASIVLLFCFNRAAFPVDTHVQRISQRTGISPRNASAEKVKVIWESLLSAHTFYALHIDLIRHGRTICQSRQPKCEICPLQELCDYYNAANEWKE